MKLLKQRQNLYLLDRVMHNSADEHKSIGNNWIIGWFLLNITSSESIHDILTHFHLNAFLLEQV
jgi:hypothetical protein